MRTGIYARFRIVRKYRRDLNKYFLRARRILLLYCGTARGDTAAVYSLRCVSSRPRGLVATITPASFFFFFFYGPTAKS